MKKNSYIIPLFLLLIVIIFLAFLGIRNFQDRNQDIDNIPDNKDIEVVINETLKLKFAYPKNSFLINDTNTLVLNKFNKYVNDTCEYLLDSENHDQLVVINITEIDDFESDRNCFKDITFEIVGNTKLPYFNNINSLQTGTWKSNINSDEGRLFSGNIVGEKYIVTISFFYNENTDTQLISTVYNTFQIDTPEKGILDSVSQDLSSINYFYNRKTTSVESIQSKTQNPEIKILSISNKKDSNKIYIFETSEVYRIINGQAFTTDTQLSGIFGEIHEPVDFNNTYFTQVNTFKGKPIQQHVISGRYVKLFDADYELSADKYSALIFSNYKYFYIAVWPVDTDPTELLKGIEFNY